MALKDPAGDVRRLVLDLRDVEVPGSAGIAIVERLKTLGERAGVQVSVV